MHKGPQLDLNWGHCNDMASILISKISKISQNFAVAVVGLTISPVQSKARFPALLYAVC